MPSDSAIARALRAGQLPLPLPPAVSTAMAIYQLLVNDGELTPPPNSSIQLSIPRWAYEYVA